MPDKNEALEGVVSGVDGASLYLNNQRIAGPKPWGGGKAVYTFSTTLESIDSALGRKSPKPPAKTKPTKPRPRPKHTQSGKPPTRKSPKDP